MTDFLTRARERKVAVPDAGFKLALDRLRNTVANTTDPGKNGGTDLAYALYVLARSGVAPIGDCRYIADAKLDALSTPIAKAQIAAALAMAGDRTRAERVYAAALAALAPAAQPGSVSAASRSTLRDAAALVALASEGGAQRASRCRPRPTRRGGARHLAPDFHAGGAVAVVGRKRHGKGWRRRGVAHFQAAQAMQRALYRPAIHAGDLKEPLRITNTGRGSVQAVVTVTGAPVTPEPAAEKGFKIERQNYTLTGDPIDPKEVKQNTRMVVVLKITEAQPQFGRVVLADHLPAGFEIDNPHLVSSGDTGTLEWISDAAEPVNSEFRDDRFTAAFERKADDAPVFTVAYVVRAVAPGKYVRPQAVVEDMYRPDRYGRTATESVEVTAAK